MQHQRQFHAGLQGLGVAGHGLSGADARTLVESSRQIASKILRKRIFIDSSSFPARGMGPGRVASYGCVSWETGGWYT
ncbi:MAG: hypothetical protein ACLU9S_12090 [Oscillospiraceae bacterium]